MSPRARRAVGAIGVLVFLTIYIIAAVSIAEYVPHVFWAQLLYFAIVGTAWGLPLIPLLSWAERDEKSRR